MIYHSIQSNDYLWYLILRGKQKKTKTPPNTMFLPIFNDRSKNEYSNQLQSELKIPESTTKKFSYVFMFCFPDLALPTDSSKT